MAATTAAAKTLSEPDHFFKYHPVIMGGGTGAWINRFSEIDGK